MFNADPEAMRLFYAGNWMEFTCHCDSKSKL